MYSRYTTLILKLKTPLCHKRLRERSLQFRKLKLNLINNGNDEDLISYLNLCLNHVYLCAMNYVQII